MGRIRMGFITIACLVGTTVTGCSDEQSAAPALRTSPTATSTPPAPPSSATSTPPPAAPADTRTPEQLVAAGRATYNANCIACHAMDPRADGALGPAVAGASPALLEARVIRGEYPEGYTPKRETRVMVPLPHLQAKLPELAAYLDSLR